MSAFVTPTPLLLSARASPATAGSLHAAALSTRATFVSARPAARARAPVLTMANDIDEQAPLDAGPAELEEMKLFVGNLSWNTNDESLGEAFGVYGTVVDARVVMDRFTGRSRGFGFIEFDSASSADKALESMNGVEVDGRSIRVDRANKRTQKKPRSDYY